jgi:hypothetical protein
MVKPRIADRASAQGEREKLDPIGAAPHGVVVQESRAPHGRKARAILARVAVCAVNGDATRAACFGERLGDRESDLRTISLVREACHALDELGTPFQSHDLPSKTGSLLLLGQSVAHLPDGEQQVVSSRRSHQDTRGPECHRLASELEWLGRYDRIDDYVAADGPQMMDEGEPRPSFERDVDEGEIGLFGRRGRDGSGDVGGEKN